MRRRSALRAWRPALSGEQGCPRSVVTRVPVRDARAIAGSGRIVHAAYRSEVAASTGVPYRRVRERRRRRLPFASATLRSGRHWAPTGRQRAVLDGHQHRSAPDLPSIREAAVGRSPQQAPAPRSGEQPPRVRVRPELGGCHPSPRAGTPAEVAPGTHLTWREEPAPVGFRALEYFALTGAETLAPVSVLRLVADQ